MKEKYRETIEKLTSCCDAKIFEHEDETDYHFSITNPSGINYWMSLSKDYEEAIIGVSFIHTHFGKQYGENYEVNDGFDFLKKILSSEIIVTNYFAGRKVYKTEYKISYKNEIEDFGSSSSLVYMFWKKKSIETEIIPPLVEKTCWYQ